MEEAAHRRAVTRPSLAASRLPDVKVLIVDDHEENLYALAQILRRDGIEILTDYPRDLESLTIPE